MRPPARWRPRPQIATLSDAGFLWGVSTAGHQYEGRNFASQWAQFEFFGLTEERSGHAANGMELFEHDLDLARDMGMRGWRMSIEWSRIEPVRGHKDPAAIAYYHRVLDAVRERGMVPMVTLIHFSYPHWLDTDLGGWEQHASVAEFERYAAWAAREFGSKIDWWLTFNEPNVFVPAAYMLGAHGPGLRSTAAALKVAANWIDAHKRAYRAIHANDLRSRVSYNAYAINYRLGKPKKPGKVSLDEDWMSEALKADIEAGRGRSLDYVAIDYYCRWSVYPGWKFTSPEEWEIYPEGFYESLREYYRAFRMPIMVAENGFATADLRPRPDGWNRENYIVQHVKQMNRARAEGIPVLGYFHWSITDNYEWGTYSPRFGLYSVDCRNRDFRRVPTPAVAVYREIATLGLTHALELRYPDPRISH
ncbi:MAG: glycoside hydrolase family 1 protein [Candidatus Sericytochromatia bacterium]|nr:glycoside hydrolase family 1 protein [Candidatus Tanganyikabacteria bacterium]